MLRNVNGVQVWSKMGLGWESCVSPGQNFLPKLSDEISVSMAPVPGTAQPQPQGAPKGGLMDPLGRLNQGALEVLTAQSHQVFALSHLKGDPGELQTIVPRSTGSLLPCCDRGTALQFITSLVLP